MNEIDGSFTKAQESIIEILAQQKTYLTQGRNTQQKIRMWRGAVKNITAHLRFVSQALNSIDYTEFRIKAKNRASQQIAFIDKLPVPEGDMAQILNMPCYLFFRKVSQGKGLTMSEKRQLTALTRQVCGYTSVMIMAQLVVKPEHELLRSVGFGKSMLALLKNLLWRHQLGLGMELEKGLVKSELFDPIEKLLKGIPIKNRKNICLQLELQDVNIVVDLILCDEGLMTLRTSLTREDVNLLKTRLEKLGHTLYQK